MNSTTASVVSELGNSRAFRTLQQLNGLVKILVYYAFKTLDLCCVQVLGFSWFFLCSSSSTTTLVFHLILSLLLFCLSEDPHQNGSRAFAVLGPSLSLDRGATKSLIWMFGDSPSDVRMFVCKPSMISPTFHDTEIGACMKVYRHSIRLGMSESHCSSPEA